MHDKPAGSPVHVPAAPPHPLKRLSPAQFAALGGGKVAFVRAMSAREIAAFIPDLDLTAPNAILHAVIGADGTPLLIADSPDALGEWLDDRALTIVYRHWGLHGAQAVAGALRQALRCP